MQQDCSQEEDYESGDNYADYGKEEGIGYSFKEEHATNVDDNYYDDIEPYENIVNIQQEQLKATSNTKFYKN